MCVGGGGGGGEVSCQLLPRGEPGNTLSGNSVAKADSCLCISCGVVQITEVVNILDLASLGKSNCTRETSGIFPDISSRALRAQGSVIIERWTASRFKVRGGLVRACVAGLIASSFGDATVYLSCQNVWPLLELP